MCVYLCVCIYIYTHTYTWQSVWLHIRMQNPQPLTAPAVIGTCKSSPTTAPYTSNEA